LRILVTNDDGVRAPGIAALAHMAAASDHEIVVVAPMVDYSGAGAAVGPVHSRDGVGYETYAIEGLDGVPTYGIDGPPALAVILACVGGFGPRPDLVLSGINLGVNVGRSALHSGTVGATLTGAQFGLRGLAVSIRYTEDPVPWDTPATLAGSLIDVLAEAPAGTTLNLNVPNVALSDLRGLRPGGLGRSGTIRSAVHDSDDGRSRPHVSLPPEPSGTLRLDLTPPGHGPPVEPGTDAWLVARGYASLTALVGVREAVEAGAEVTLGRSLDALYAIPGVGAGPIPDDSIEDEQAATG
jgi:5'-nucleotidase